MSLIEKIIIGTLLVVGILFYVDYNARKEERSAYAHKIESGKEVERILKRDSSKQLQIKDEQIKTINARVGVLIRELHTRPSRSTTTPDTPSCTGRELYREDGEFLAREAARAEKIIKERDFYYEQYEEARKALERLQNGKN
jgi:hypothetical protein